MATYRKSQNARGTRWLAQVRCAGIRTSQTFDTKAAAVDWARELERVARLADKGLGPLAKQYAAHLTVGQAVTRYKAERADHLAGGRNVKAHLAVWVDLLGADTPLEAVQTRDLLAARESLRKGRTAATVNRYVASIRRLYSVAVREWGACPANPAAGLSSLREPGGRIRWLDKEERDNLLRECAASKNPDLHCAVLVSLSTAMRRGELMRLEWRDVDLVAGLLTVRAENSKTNTGRVIPLSAPALAALRARRPSATAPRVFPFAVDHFRSAFTEALNRANIVNFHWHDLRHTAASMLAMEGATPLDIAAFTGHTTLAMVKRYAHLSNAHTRTLADRVGARLLEPPQDSGSGGSS